MSSDALTHFGKLLIEEVRDNAIRDSDMFVRGVAKDEESQKLYQTINIQNESVRKALEAVIPRVVDKTIFYLLALIEGSDEIELRLAHEGSNANLVDLSDGLSAEPFTEHGWIVKFSKEREGYEN